MAIQTNIELWAGDEKVLSIQVRNDAGTPVPLVDVSEITFLMKTRPEERTPTLTKTLLDGIEVVDESDGIYEVTLSPTDLQDMDGAYYWESVVTDQTTSPYTAAFGYAAVHGKGFTRAAYCTLEEAMALMADVQINEDTIPNKATAELILETIARDIDGILLGKGVVLPVTDAQALSFLRTVNQYGACAAIIKSKKPVDTGMASDRGAFGYYEGKFQQKLAQLSDPTFSLFTFDDEGQPSIMAAGWTIGPAYPKDPDEPFWTRRTRF